MLPESHQSRTEKLLNINNVDSPFTRAQVMSGCIANDYGELTNEGSAFLGAKRRIEKIIDEGLGKKDESGTKILGEKRFALAQLHFGAAVGLHAMAVKSGLPAADTHRDVLCWLSFLRGVFFEEIVIEPFSLIADIETCLKPMFAGTRISFGRLFDSDEQEAIRFRSLGMILHLIQDSFTISHCCRNATTLRLEQFYYYRDQDLKIHGAKDYVDGAMNESLLRIENSVYQEMMAGNREYAIEQHFALEDQTKPSDRGVC